MKKLYIVGVLFFAVMSSVVSAGKRKRNDEDLRYRLQLKRDIQVEIVGLQVGGVPSDVTEQMVFILKNHCTEMKEHIFRAALHQVFITKKQPSRVYRHLELLPPSGSSSSQE